MNRTAVLCTTIASAALLGSAALLTAGPLNPPSGAVTSTYRTLTEVEPRIPISLATTPGDADSLFKIIQPGSYYLTGNITGVAGKHGIEIAADNVSLDLRGHTLTGVAGSLSGVVTSTVGLKNIAIENGTALSWGTSGFDLATFSIATGRLSGLHASDNGNYGVRGGNQCLIADCVAANNGGTGIGVVIGGNITNCVSASNTIGYGGSIYSSIQNCVAYANDQVGIQGGSASVVINCSSTFSGTEGIAVGTGSTVEGNDVLGSGTNGIRVTFGSTIRGNTVRQSGNNGVGAGIIVTGSQNRIDSNNCSLADRGIEITASGNFLTRNICGNNTTNYVISIGNVFLAVNAATNPAAVSGSSGGVAPGSTDPNANFSY